MYNNQKGVTLVILTVTIIVLLIIIGVVVRTGVGSIREAEVTSVKTNLLLIQAKGKEYVENTNFNIGTAEKSEEEKASIKQEYLKGTKYEDELPEGIELADGQEAYSLSAENMEEMGLNELSKDAQDYIIIYNIGQESVDVIYVPGIDYEDNKYYTLSSLQEAGV